MQVLYIDVYFLINFTVDLLALYFAAELARIKSTVFRLISSSLIGAFAACVIVLNEPGIFNFAIIAILTNLSITLIFVKRQPFLRRFKFFTAFSITEALIGGLVGFFYTVLDVYLAPQLGGMAIGAESSRNILISLMILLVYGVLRIVFLLFFGAGDERNASVTLCISGKEEKHTALIDSGNLLIDPISNTPVMLIKKNSSRLLSSYKNLLGEEALKNRIRLIPAKGLGCVKILTGIRTDYIRIDEREKMDNYIIAIDEEEGTFGGYTALLPSTLAEL